MRSTHFLPFRFVLVLLCLTSFVPLAPTQSNLAINSNKSGNFKDATRHFSARTEQLIPSPDRSHSFAANSLDSGTSLFAPSVAYDAPYASNLAVADLRKNGIQDILAIGFDGQTEQPLFYVLLGNGDGTFQSPVSYSVSAADYIATGDLNGDGYPDVVVASPTSLSVLLGNGDGTFQPATSYALLGSECSSPLDFLPIIIADVNGDGTPDLVVASQSSNGCGDGIVNVLIGVGNGTFKSPIGYDSGGFEITWLAVADLSGDGTPDIVVANCGVSSHTCLAGGDGVVGVLLGEGKGKFASVITYPTTGPLGGGAILDVVDMNGDGIPDIVTGGYCPAPNGGCVSDASVDVFIGNGDGTFQAAVGYDSGAQSANAMVVADLNGDGKLDVAIANESGASVLLGNGNGTLQPAQTYFIACATNQAQVLDVNGDGKLDLVVSGGSALAQPAESAVMLGKGDGTFYGPLLFDIGADSLPFVWALVADMTGNNRPDLLAVSNGTIEVFLNNANFVFNNTATTLAASPNPSSPDKTVTYTAVITPQLGGTATGWVWLLDSGFLGGAGQIANNQAVIPMRYKTNGFHQITAVYSGDSNLAGSYSSQVDVKVQGHTVTHITTSGSPSLVGQAVTFTATITSTYGAIPNGETVTFSLNNTVLGTGTTSGGVATLTTALSNPGSHYIKASYPGDDTFAPSTAIVSQTVNLYSSSTTLMSKPNPSTVGEAVTLTATVTSSAPGGPTGKVTFKNGSTTLGTAILSAGVATLTTKKLPAGTLTLTADYDGDKQSAKSAGTTTQVVN